MKQNVSFQIVYDFRGTATPTRRSSVCICAYYARRRKYLGTDIKLFPNQWDSNKRMVVRHPEALTLNSILTRRLARLQSWAQALDDCGEKFTFEKLEDFLNRRQLSDSYIEFVREQIANRLDIRDSTKRTQRKLVKALEDFGGIVEFSDLTISAIRRFDDFLRERGIKQPTIHSYHKTNKTYVYEALRREIISQNPYANFKTDRGKNTRIMYLTRHELKRIELLELGCRRLRVARDLFLFQCYTGMAYSDLANFDASAIEERGGRLVYLANRQKTGERFYIAILPQAAMILERYDGVLPIISNQKMNDFLKEIAKLAGVKRDITTHMGRHTFATLALSMGVPIERVAKMLGHADIKTTQNYAKVLDDDLEREFDKLAAGMW